MKKLIHIFLAGALSIGSVSNALAAGDGGPFAAENFSATLTLTTDYAFRGTSFSDKGPAIQGSFDWGYGSWFAGAWGTSTTPQDDNGLGGTLELDLYVGWASSVSGFDVMIMPLLYTFPDQQGSGARDDMTFELWTAIGRGFENLPGSPYINLEFNWSPDYFDHVDNPSGDDAFYIRPSIAFTLPNGFGLDFGYGYQDVGGTASNDFFADDYGHIDIGITKSALGFDFDLRYHDNLDENTLNQGQNFAFDNDIVFSVSRSF